MSDKLPLFAAALIGLIVGAAVMYAITPAREGAPPAPPKAGNTFDAPDNAAAPISPDPDADRGVPEVLAELKAANERAAALEREVATLSRDKEGLTDEKTELESEVKRLNDRVEELIRIAAGPNRMLVAFGEWAEVRELRETDWLDVGDAVSKMTPHLGELAAAALAGRTPDPAVMRNIQEHNSRVLAHYGKMLGKLPTHSTYNGEFTHPIYLVNMLAAQLEAAGKPLDDDQMQKLAALGDDYDQRWNALSASYTDATWPLQKVLDEAELKGWFVARMFEVTTPEQKRIAVPPEIEGYVGLDLYSPGLMLAASIAAFREANTDAVREKLIQRTAEMLNIDAERLAGATHVFDNWISALGPQLQPRTAAAASLHRFSEVMAAGKAQLAAMKALETSFAVTDEDRAHYAAVAGVLLPYVITE